MTKLAIIGGSGLYAMEGLTEVNRHNVDTPYGAPSDEIVHARLSDAPKAADLFFLPRHGRGHSHAPSQINYRANICALKKLGVDAVLSVSAVGSMKEEIAPGDLVIVDQFIDLTKRRAATFFDESIIAHVAMADPVCPVFAAAVFEAASSTGATVHRGGTYVCIEGPQFSTRAESLVYRSWGVSVIGMTNMPEAKLAREAELPYATLALSTDYDCWHEDEEDVSVEAVLRILKENAVKAQQTAKYLAQNLPDLSSSPATTALANAVITHPGAGSIADREKLSWLLKSDA